VNRRPSGSFGPLGRRMPAGRLNNLFLSIRDPSASKRPRVAVHATSERSERVAADERPSGARRLLA
jgi:hypothetical protein